MSSGHLWALPRGSLFNIGSENIMYQKDGYILRISKNEDTDESYKDD